MPNFHELTVSRLDRLTEDAVRITLAVPDELREAYAFLPGQHLTFAHRTATGVIRRTFSICSSPTSGELSVAVKVLPSGVFSRYVAEELRTGDQLTVMTPAGRFTPRTPPAGGSRTVAAIVAGSGITPVMSIMTTLLETEPETRFVLCYGNRRVTSVMFAEDIADLKDRFLSRLQVFHMISGEEHDAPLLAGRIDAERLRVLLRLHRPAEVDEWFLCGPLGLLEMSRAILLERGAPDDAIHRELFFTGATPGLGLAAVPAEADSKITFRLDGRTSTAALPPGGSVLDAVLGVRPDAPFACRNGVCGTCRMKLLQGEVSMAQNFALERYELASGFRLACQSVPQTKELEVDFDA